MEQLREGFEEELNRETARRIEEMEKPDYTFPRRFGRKDYLLWGAAVAACLLCLILGARL